MRRIHLRAPANSKQPPGPRAPGLSNQDPGSGVAPCLGQVGDSAAVITEGSSPAARVTTLQGLQPLRIGAQVGTTSATAAGAVGADLPVAVYNTNVDAKIALRSGEIDALVLDMPTTFAAAADLDGGIVTGLLPAEPDLVEQLGIMLDKGSPLTPCVSGAVETLREGGVLAELEKTWLAAGSLPRLLS